MDQKFLLDLIITALGRIRTPRFFESERGFQGALLAELKPLIPVEAQGDEAIIEQEYQKRLDSHGVRLRPDIIIHEPFDDSKHSSRRDGNYLVIELKLRANAKAAAGDFESLAEMIDVLEYRSAVFINIASAEKFSDLIPERFKDRITAISVLLDNGNVQIVA
ncbi:hypothetical protein [Caballeronia sp. GaOx3]|uniref:hypothetical protein n=1 Tax=Caballeronia sp. GaOx3 TaxID=2921740 RepID=UPI00202884F2|nr:hypothetical protein [Caballeronia sp. GaOx3]